MNNILNDYVCKHPFNYMDVSHTGVFLCCPSWLPIDISVKDDDNNIMIDKTWNGPIAEKIRASVLSGDYTYCNKNTCPELNTLLNGDTIPSVFVHKSEFNRDDFTNPTEILYGQDRSCNLKCPSCRSNVIPNDKIESKAHKKKQKLQDDITHFFGSTLIQILLTGSGDPIYSKIYRDFLFNFQRKDYPVLESIHLVTHGMLLDQKTWNKISCIEYIDVIDIGIDAGTKYTYEHVSRLNGNWNRLLDNVAMLAALTDKKRSIIFSYVVTQHNYKEMYQLYNIIRDIFKDSKSNCYFNFRQIMHWETGKYTKDEVKSISVFDTSHDEFADFLDEIKRIDKLENVNHNFHHLLHSA